MSDPFRDIEKAESGKPPEEIVFWDNEINLARQRESKWRKEARRIIKIYEGDSIEENSFNILYSNTELLLPALYNQSPKPQVDRRYHDADPLAKASAEALQRTLEYLVDSENEDYDNFSTLMGEAVLGALVPGRGLTRFVYDPKFASSAAAVGDSEGRSDDVEGAEELQDPSKNPAVPIPGSKRVEYEMICGKDVDYDEFLFGYARRWRDVPWIAYEHWMEYEDLVVNFGEEKARKIPLEDRGGKKAGWKEDEGQTEREQFDKGSLKGAYVLEIWNKRKREVLFYCPAYKDALLARKEDPYKLSGFFNCPKPLRLISKVSGLHPTPLYRMYKEQAKELNRVSMRINRLLNALKVRGFYDGTLQGLKDLLTADDNTMKEIKNAAGLSDGKNLTNAVQFFPVEKIITVLQVLWQAREQIKNTIYEITGLSDIFRGDTQASETLGAQRLKAQFGTQRLSKFQRGVARYVRDCVQIMGELAANHFGEPTFVGMSNLPFATSEQLAQAKRLLPAVQQWQAQQQPAMPGQPPAAPPPQVQQAMQQIQQTQSVAAWPAVIQLLRKTPERFYRIDIETNSTIAATTADDKEAITDAMTAITNTMEAFAGPVEARVFPMPAFKKILLTIVRRFTFGKEVEDALNMIPDQVPDTVNNTPEMKSSAGGTPKTPEELQATVAKSKYELASIQMKTQELDRNNQRQLAEHEAKMKELAREEEVNAAKHIQQMTELSAKKEATIIDVNAKKSLAATQVNTAKLSSQVQLEHAAKEGELKRQGMAAEGDIKRQNMAADSAARQNAAATSQSSTPPAKRKFKLKRGEDNRISEIHEA